MPCRSDYMEPNSREIELSKVYALQKELDTKVHVDSKTYGDGHGEAYGNASQITLDKATANLCKRLTGLDVSSCSLELQIWWRDHQEGDKRRAKEG